MPNTRTYIQDYTNLHPSFNREDLFTYLSGKADINKSALSWYLHKLVDENFLVRTGRGIYARVMKQSFAPVASKEAARTCSEVQEHFPFARFCVYQGEIIGPLQHHLYSNAVIYVETGRDNAESVFNYLKETGREVYLRPDRDMIYRYIDMDRPVCFVKNLVSEAPLQKIDGVPMPTVEKLLVDILRDADFFYLRGVESEHIIENAFNLYEINRSRLFRYAERRKVKADFISILENLNLA